MRTYPCHIMPYHLMGHDPGHVTRWGSTHKWTLLDPFWDLMGTYGDPKHGIRCMYLYACTCIYMYIGTPCIGGIYSTCTCAYTSIHLICAHDVQHEVMPCHLKRSKSMELGSNHGIWACQDLGPGHDPGPQHDGEVLKGPTSCAYMYIHPYGPKGLYRGICMYIHTCTCACTYICICIGCNDMS